jgi:hypothetical protein
MAYKRVLVTKEGTYYGYGDTPKDIVAVTSCHEKGNEPIHPKYMFDRVWEPAQGSFMYDGFAYITWKPWNETLRQE